jgi:hypothetical protein
MVCNCLNDGTLLRGFTLVLHLLSAVHEIDGKKMTLDISKKKQYASLVFPAAPRSAKLAKNAQRPSVMLTKIGEPCSMHITVSVNFDARLLAFCKIVIDGSDVAMAKDYDGYCIAMNIKARFVVTDSRPAIAELFERESSTMKNPHVQVYRSDRPCVDWKGAFAFSEMMADSLDATIVPPRFTQWHSIMRYNRAMHIRARNNLAEYLNREIRQCALVAKLSASSARNSLAIVRNYNADAAAAVARAKCVAAVAAAKASAAAALDASNRAKDAARRVRHLVPMTRNQRRNQRRRARK